MSVNRRQAKIITDQLTEFVAIQNARVARNALRELRDATPVKTGHAASNWIGSLDRPRTGVAGSKQRVDFRPQNASLSTLNRRNIKIQNIFITNNVEYIDVLNTGTSTKAPAGFIQAAISRALLR